MSCTFAADSISFRAGVYIGGKMKKKRATKRD